MISDSGAGAKVKAVLYGIDSTSTAGIPNRFEKLSPAVIFPRPVLPSGKLTSIGAGWALGSVRRRFVDRCLNDLLPRRRRAGDQELPRILALLALLSEPMFGARSLNCNLNTLAPGLKLPITWPSVA